MLQTRACIAACHMKKATRHSSPGPECHSDQAHSSPSHWIAWAHCDSSCMSLQFGPWARDASDIHPSHAPRSPQSRSWSANALFSWTRDLLGWRRYKRCDLWMLERLADNLKGGHSRISRIPTAKTPIKSRPASAQRFFVTLYCSIASSPETLLIGEKKRCAPFGSQSTQRSSSNVGMPWSVFARVCKSWLLLTSSGKKNWTPLIDEKACLICDHRTFRIGSGPFLMLVKIANLTWVMNQGRTYIECPVEVPSAQIKLLCDCVQLTLTQRLLSVRSVVGLWTKHCRIKEDMT